MAHLTHAHSHIVTATEVSELDECVSNFSDHFCQTSRREIIISDKNERADLELVDEVVFLQQLVADVLECVPVPHLVDLEHVEGPIIHVLQHTTTTTLRNADD